MSQPLQVNGRLEIVTNSRSKPRSTEPQTEQQAFCGCSGKPLFVLAVPARSTGEGNMRILGKTYNGVLFTFENARTPSDASRLTGTECNEVCE
jgi:hypothetical protein